MKRRLAGISCLVLCFACTPEDRKIPPDILAIDKMKVIIWDMTEAGEYATFLKEKDSTIRSLNTAYFSEVLSLHHINKNSFTKSFDFYQAHPSLNKILMDSVYAYASRQRVDMYKKRE